MMEPTAAALHTATTLAGKSCASCCNSTQRQTISTERHTSLRNSQHPMTETKTPTINCYEPAYADVVEKICKLWRRFLNVPHAILLFLAGVLVRITFLIFGIGSLREAQVEPTRRRVRYNSVRIPPHMCAPSVARSIKRPTAFPSNAVVPVRCQQTMVPRVKVNNTFNNVMPVEMRTPSVVRLNNQPTASPSNAVVPVRSQQAMVSRVKLNRPFNIVMPVQMRTPSVARLNARPTASPSNAVVPVRSNPSFVSAINRASKVIMSSQMRTPSVVRLNNRPTASPSNAVVPIRRNHSLVSAIKSPSKVVMSSQMCSPMVMLNKRQATFLSNAVVPIRSHLSLVLPFNKTSKAVMSSQMRTPSVIRVNNRPPALPTKAVVPIRSYRSWVLPLSKTSKAVMLSQMHTPSVTRVNNRPPALPSKAVVPIRSYRSWVLPFNKPSKVVMSSQMRTPSAMRINNKQSALPSKAVLPRSQQTSVPNYDRILNWVITSANQRTKSVQDESRRQVPISLTIPLEEFKFGHPRACHTMKEDQSLALVCQRPSKDSVKTVKDLDLLSPLAPKDVTLSQKLSAPTSKRTYFKEFDVPAELEIHNITFTLTLPLAGLCEVSARLCVVFRPECIVQVRCSRKHHKAIVKIMNVVGLPSPSRSPSASASPNSSISLKTKYACSKPASPLVAKRFKEAARQPCLEMIVQSKADQEVILPEPETQTTANNGTFIPPDDIKSVMTQKETDDNSRMHPQKETQPIQITLSSTDIKKLEEAFSGPHWRKTSCELERQSASLRHHKPLGSQPLASRPFARNQLFYYRKAREVRKLAVRKGCNDVRTGQSLAFQNKRNEKNSSRRDMTMAVLQRESRGSILYRKMSGGKDSTGALGINGRRPTKNATVRNYEADDKRTGQAHSVPSGQLRTTKPMLTTRETKENRFTSSVSSSEKKQDQGASEERTGQMHPEYSRQTYTTKPKSNAQQTKENRFNSTCSSGKKPDQGASEERTAEMHPESSGQTGTKYTEPKSNSQQTKENSTSPSSGKEKEQSVSDEKTGQTHSSGQTPTTKPNKNVQQTKKNSTLSTSSSGKEKEQSASDEKTGNQAHSMSSVKQTTAKPRIHSRETEEDQFTHFCKEYFRKAAGSKTVLSPPSFGLIEAVNRLARRRTSLLKDNKPWKRKWSSKRRKRHRQNKKSHEKHRKTFHSARNLPRNSPKRVSLDGVPGKKDANKDKRKSKDAKGNKTEGSKMSSLKEAAGKALEVASEILQTATSCIREEIADLTEDNDTQDVLQQGQAHKVPITPVGNIIAEPVTTVKTSSQTLNEDGTHAQETKAKNTEVSDSVDSVQLAQPKQSADKLSKKVESEEESSYQPPSLEDIQEAAQNIKTMFSSLFLKDAEEQRTLQDRSHVTSACTRKTLKDTNQEQNTDEGSAVCLTDATTHTNTMLPVIEGTLRRRPEGAQNIDTVLPLAQETDQVTSINRPKTKQDANTVLALAEECDQAQLVTAPELRPNVNPASSLVDKFHQLSSVCKTEVEESVNTAFLLPLERNIQNRGSVSLSQASPDTGNLEPESSDIDVIEGRGCHLDSTYCRFDVEHELTQDINTVAQDPALRIDQANVSQASLEPDERKRMVPECMDSHAAPVDEIYYAEQGPVMLGIIDSKAEASQVTDEEKGMSQQCMDNHAALVGETHEGQGLFMPEMEISGQFNIKQSPSGLTFHVSGDVSTSDQNLLERIQVSGNVDVHQIPSAEGLKISTNLNIIPSISGRERAVFQNEMHTMDGECKRERNENTTVIGLEDVAVDSSTTEYIQQEQPLYVAVIPYVQEQYGQEYMSTVARTLDTDGQGPTYLEAYLVPLEQGNAVPDIQEGILSKNEVIQLDLQQTEEFKTGAKTAVCSEACLLPEVEEYLETRSASQGVTVLNYQIRQRKKESQVSNLSAPEVETAEKHPEGADEVEAGQLSPLEATAAATGTTLLPLPASTEHQPNGECNIELSQPLSECQEDILTRVSTSQGVLENTALAPRTKTPKETRSEENTKESLLRIEKPNGHSREVDKFFMSRAAELVDKGIFVLSESGTIDAIVDTNRVTREDVSYDMYAFSRTSNHHEVIPTQLQQKIITTAQDEGLNNRVINAESTKPSFAKARDKIVRGQIIEDRDGDQIMIDETKPHLTGTYSQLFSHIYHPFWSEMVSHYCNEPQRNGDVDMMSDEQESVMDIASGGNSQTSLMEYEDCDDRVMGQYCRLCKELQRQKSSSSSLPFSQVQGQPQATQMLSWNGNSELSRVAMFDPGNNVQIAPEKHAPFLPPGHLNQTSFFTAGNYHTHQATIVPGCNGQTFLNQPSSVEQPVPRNTDGTKSLPRTTSKTQASDNQVLIHSHPSTKKDMSDVQDAFAEVSQIVQGRGNTTEKTDAHCSPQHEETRHDYSDVEASDEHTDDTQENEGLSPVAPSMLDLCASADIGKLLHSESLSFAQNLKSRTPDIRDHSGYERSTGAATSQETGKSAEVAAKLPKVDGTNGMSGIGSAATFHGKLHSSDCQALQLVAHGTSKKSESVVRNVVPSKDEIFPEKSLEEKYLPSTPEATYKKHLVDTTGLPQANEEGSISAVSYRRKVIVPRKRVSLSSTERKAVAFEDLFGQDTQPGSNTTSLSGKKRPRDVTTEVNEQESTTELKRRRKVHFSDVVQVCVIDTLSSTQSHSVSSSITKTAVSRKGILKNSKSRMAKG